MVVKVKQNNRDIFANSSSVKELLRHFNKIKSGISDKDSREFLRHIERVQKRELLERQASVKLSEIKKAKTKTKTKAKAKAKTSGKGAGGNVRNATIGMGFPKPDLVKISKK